MLNTQPRSATLTRPGGIIGLCGACEGFDFGLDCNLAVGEFVLVVDEVGLVGLGWVGLGRCEVEAGFRVTRGRSG